MHKARHALARSIRWLAGGPPVARDR